MLSPDEAVYVVVRAVKPAPPLAETVTAPVAPLIDMPVPATMLVTPAFVIVTAPVAPLTDMPVPATFDVTPAFVSVIELPKATAPPPDIPVPAVTVTEELVNAALATPDNVPPNVKLPDEVTVPVRVIPLTVPVPATDVTVPEVAGAVLDQVVPLEVSTLPDVLGATNKGVDVPLPNMTLLAVRVERPVPPCATVTSVSASSILTHALL
jgi:hypothetical protein